jgi:hypothetical protein
MECALLILLDFLVGVLCRVEINALKRCQSRPSARFFDRSMFFLDLMVVMGSIPHFAFGVQIKFRTIFWVSPIYVCSCLIEYSPLQSTLQPLATLGR